RNYKAIPQALRDGNWSRRVNEPARSELQSHSAGSTCDKPLSDTATVCMSELQSHSEGSTCYFLPRIFCVRGCRNYKATPKALRGTAPQNAVNVSNTKPLRRLYYTCTVCFETSRGWSQIQSL